MRGKEVYNINRNPVRRFFRKTGEFLKDLLIIVKPLVMIGLLIWGGIKYLTQGGRRTINQGMKAQIESLTNDGIGKDFKEGLGVIRECVAEARYNNSPQGKAHRKAYFEEQQKRREELNKMGVGPIQYLKPGDPGYKEELEFQRNLRKDLER